MFAGVFFQFHAIIVAVGNPCIFANTTRADEFFVFPLIFVAAPILGGWVQ